jgi:hypothetical protein
MRLLGGQSGAEGDGAPWEDREGRFTKGDHSPSSSSLKQG